jgi:hypothetical protein
MVYEGTEIIARMKQLEDFTKVPSRYHIVGVRSLADETDKFDDTFYLFEGETLIMMTSGTTNPGAKILKGGFRRYNKDGAAVLEADRIYYNVWKYGKHLGYMPALKQLGAPVTVWRDGDLDGKSEEKGKRTTGWYGINFHTATKSYLSNIIKTFIGGWSAGCQVCNNAPEYMSIINKVKDQSSVTYTLLNEFNV